MEGKCLFKEAVTRKSPSNQENLCMQPSTKLLLFPHPFSPLKTLLLALELWRLSLDISLLSFQSAGFLNESTFFSYQALVSQYWFLISEQLNLGFPVTL